MVTISHLVKSMINEKPFLQEALSKNIVSFGNLAEQILPKIETELDKKVKHSAVVMSLRRYAQELEQLSQKPKQFNFKSEIVMKTNICDICVVKSPALMTKIKNMYDLVSFEKGDTLNIILGDNEISIVTNEKHKERFLKSLKGEKIQNKESNLVSLTMRFSDDFIHTPGVISTIVRNMSWENINMFEVVSTLSELTLIIRQKDSTRAYVALQKLIEA